MSEVVEKLRRFEKLSDCSEDELAELAEHSVAVNVPPRWAFERLLAVAQPRPSAQ
jgi:hypothetical protein